jgi:hypothetical protein
MGTIVVICRPLPAAFVAASGVCQQVKQTLPLAKERTGMDTRFAAAYIGYSPATLRLWRRKGAGPKFHNVGRFIEYQQEDLDAWSGGEEMAALRRAERRAKATAKVRANKRAPASDFGNALAGVNLGNWS